ncbi:MAG: hypothetical protein OXG97_03965 [Candidatus Poribacteria bacterium]|nr:hypothetical protein [Candidatus Poribacteria bacterium]
MNSKTTKRFRQMLSRLSRDIRQQAREAYRLFSKDPRHPSLRFKKVHATESIYAARININYRVVGVVDNGEIVWFWVGPHTEYEKLLNEL